MYRKKSRKGRSKAQRPVFYLIFLLISSYIQQAETQKLCVFSTFLLFQCFSVLINITTSCRLVLIYYFIYFIIFSADALLYTVCLHCYKLDAGASTALQGSGNCVIMDLKYGLLGIYHKSNKSAR